MEGAQAEANKAEEERVKMHNERKKKEARQALELEKIRVSCGIECFVMSMCVYRRKQDSCAWCFCTAPVCVRS